MASKENQEALGKIRKQIPNIKDGTDFVYSVDVLQQAIDDLEKMIIKCETQESIIKGFQEEYSKLVYLVGSEKDNGK